MRPRYDPYIILKECQGTPKPHGAVDKFEGDSKQPLGHQVLAYRNVMRCKWAVRKTARPKNGGRLAAQIRAKKSEARQSGFTFFGPDLGSQDGPRFGAVSGKSIKKKSLPRREKREEREDRDERREKNEKI